MQQNSSPSDILVAGIYEHSSRKNTAEALDIATAIIAVMGRQLTAAQLAQIEQQFPETKTLGHFSIWSGTLNAGANI